MNWYIAKMVFRIISGDGNHLAQFDEQLRLINAPNQQEAFEKATEMGNLEQHSFLNKRNEIVKWEFINVPELNKLSSLEDGVELYSRVNEYENGKRFVEVVNKKADALRSAFTNILPEPV